MRGHRTHSVIASVHANITAAAAVKVTWPDAYVTTAMSVAVVRQQLPLN